MIRANERMRSAVVIAATLAVLAWQMTLFSAQGSLFFDFRAFYCGGAAVLHGQNPYLAHSLLACESAPAPFGLHRSPAGVTLPVPFPGYAFALFAPFALLPFVPACVAWLLLILGTGFGAYEALARITNRSFAGVAAVFAFGLSTAVWTLGQLSSIVLFALVLCAFSLRRGLLTRAVAALCAAAVLPHVVAPAFLALFLYEKRSRWPLVCGVLVLIALDLVIGGPRLALSYFVDVLPAHSQSEIGDVSQYGLTWLLAAAHVGERFALAAGTISYAAMSAIGIVLAGSLARKTGERAFIVLLPPAFAVIGGAFIHYPEIMLALPALMLLCVHAQGAARAVCSSALLLLAIPWQGLHQLPLVIPAVLAAFAITLLYLRISLAWAVRSAALCVFAAGVIALAAAQFGPQLATGGAAVHLNSQLAQASWAAYVHANSVSGGVFWWIAKAPTWIGLLLLAFGGAYVLAKKDFVPAIPVEQVPVTL